MSAQDGQCARYMPGTATAAIMDRTRPRTHPVTRARDSPKYEVLRDPAVRLAKHLEYRAVVDAAQAKDTSGQFAAKESGPEHAPPETRDRAAGTIAGRR